ncbi:hypothetical protein GCM10009646_70470 [Streptomyces aureus]
MCGAGRRPGSRSGARWNPGLTPSSPTIAAVSTDIDTKRPMQGWKSAVAVEPPMLYAAARTARRVRIWALSRGRPDDQESQIGKESRGAAEKCVTNDWVRSALSRNPAQCWAANSTSR